MAAWMIVPAVFAARYLHGSSNPTQDAPTYAQQELAKYSGMKVIPSALNARLQDPHQPMLNDQVGYPQQLAPKTYRGKVELLKPFRLDGPRPNFEQTLVNMGHVPRSNPSKRMMFMQQAYQLGNKGMALPWNPQIPDKRPYTNQLWYIKRNVAEHNEHGGRGRRVVRVPMDRGYGAPVSRVITRSVN